jgi:hypothetical protein
MGGHRDSPSVKGATNLPGRRGSASSIHNETMHYTKIFQSKSLS